MSLHNNIAAAIECHNKMAVTLSRIAKGLPSEAQRIAMKTLADCGLDPDNVLAVHKEFEPIYAKLRKLP